MAVGAPRAKIVNVNVSALEVKAGDLVSVCYTVEHARAVTIEPIGFRGGPAGKGCATDHPENRGTYTISALGADGEKDQERVTVRVKSPVPGVAASGVFPSLLTQWAGVRLMGV